MKAVAAFLLAVLGITTAAVSPAQADDYYYWPDYGSFASHNEWSYRQVRAEQAHQLGATGLGVKVAILDDGLAQYATGLRNKVIAYKDFIPGQFMQGEHGTMVASTVASDYESSVGIGGIAPNASLLIARVCSRNGCEWEAMRKAVSWAVESGAQVISLSIAGMSEPYMLAVFAAAISKGVTVVTSMGNSGCGPYSSYGLNPYCLVGKTRENSLGVYPIAGLLAVGASNPDGGRVATLGWSSSYGPNHDIMAPGIDTSAYDAFAASNGFGGTSSAAPIVAGVAALILQLKPDLTPAQVQAIIQSTATKPIEEKAKVWDECNKDAETQVWNCNNIIDSTFDQQYFTGAGIVNAEAAVSLTKRWINGGLLGAPSIIQNNRQITVEWPNGPADVIINSKVVARNVSSGFTYQGFDNQSVAVQISRFGRLSQPTIAMVVNEVEAPKPTVIRGWSFAQEFYLDLGNLDPITDSLWSYKPWWDPEYAEYSGVFEFDNGEMAGCRGIRNKTYLDTTFTCSSPHYRTTVTGTFRFVGKDSRLGPASEVISFNPQNVKRTMEAVVNYSDLGIPTFRWEPVEGALSYQYRYESEYILHCTSDTAFTPEQLSLEPRVFQIWAKSSSDCQGDTLGQLETMGYTFLPPKPAKPSGITVKYASYEQIEFDVPNREPESVWRIYRSDGQMTRIFPGQRFIVQVQANEDVNGKVFSFRFAKQTRTTWSDSWSELSDPVTASFNKLPSFPIECQIGIKNEVLCDSAGMNGVSGMRIDYLNSAGELLTGVDYENQSERPRYRIKKVRGAFYVRVALTVGYPNRRDSIYRRGEDVILEISQRRIVDQMYQPQ